MNARTMSWVSLLAVALVPAGCVYHPRHETREMRESRSVEAGEVESVRAQVEMGAGELRIRGGAQKLLEADFEYNVPGWKPEVRYNRSLSRGYLTVRQPSSVFRVGGRRYQWDLRFNNKTPLDLRVNLGAGQSDLNLAGLVLNALEVHMGVGTLKLDLDGTWRKDFHARISGGVGSAEVRLPRDVGVRVSAHGGLGGIHTRGLRRSSGYYVNDAYGRSDVTLRINISGGIGQIELIG